jgi:hypothetical protein
MKLSDGDTWYLWQLNSDSPFLGDNDLHNLFLNATCSSSFDSNSTGTGRYLPDAYKPCIICRSEAHPTGHCPIARDFSDYYTPPPNTHRNGPPPNQANGNMYDSSEAQPNGTLTRSSTNHGRGSPHCGIRGQQGSQGHSRSRGGCGRGF